MAGPNNVGFNITGAVNITAPNTGQAAAGLQNVAQALNKVVTGGTAAEERMKQALASITKNFQTMGANTQAAGNQAQAMGTKVITAVKAIEGGYMSAGSAFARYNQEMRAAATGTVQVLDQQASGVKRFANTVANAFTVSGQTAKDYLQSVQSSMAARLTGVWAALRYARQAGDAMREIDLLRASMQRITGDQQATAYSMQHASDVAQRYSIHLRDVTSATVELARQGRSLADITTLTENMAEVRLLLATSTGRLMGMSDMIQHVTTLMNQLDLSTYEAVRGLRIMAQMDIETAASFDRIGQALNKFAATGKMARMSMDEIIMAATAFTEAGFTGEQAGTALNTILSRVGRNKDALDFMKQFGVELTTVKDGVYSTNNSLNMLADTYEHLKKQGRFMDMREFLNMYAGTRMQSKLIAGLEVLIRRRADYQQMIETATSTEQDAVEARKLAIDTMLNTLESKRIEVANAFNKVFIAPKFIGFYKAFLDEMVGVATTFAQTTTDMTRGVLGVAGLGNAEQGLANLASLFRLYLLVKIPATVAAGMKYLAATLTMRAADVGGVFDAMKGRSLEDTWRGGPGLLTQIGRTTQQVRVLNEDIIALSKNLARLKAPKTLLNFDAQLNELTKLNTAMNQSKFLQNLSGTASTISTPLSNLASVNQRNFKAQFANLRTMVESESTAFQTALVQGLTLNPAQQAAITKGFTEVKKKVHAELNALASTNKGLSAKARANLLQQMQQTATTSLRQGFTDITKSMQVALPPVDNTAFVQSLQQTRQTITGQMGQIKKVWATVLPKDNPFLTETLAMQKGVSQSFTAVQKELVQTGKITEQSMAQATSAIQGFSQQHQQLTQRFVTSHAGQHYFKQWEQQVTKSTAKMQVDVKKLYDMIETPRVQRSGHAPALKAAADEAQKATRHIGNLTETLKRKQQAGELSAQQITTGMAQIQEATKKTEAQVATLGKSFQAVTSSWKLAVMSLSTTLLNIIGVIGIVTTVVYGLSRAWNWVTSSIRDAAGELDAFRKLQQGVQEFDAALGRQKSQAEQERQEAGVARTTIFEGIIRYQKQHAPLEELPSLDKYTKQVTDLLILLENYFRNPDEYKSQVESREQEFPGLAQAIENFIQGLQEQRDAEGKIVQPGIDLRDPAALNQATVEFLTQVAPLPDKIVEAMLSTTPEILAGFQQFFALVAQNFPALTELGVIVTTGTAVSAEAEKATEAIARVFSSANVQLIQNFVTEAQTATQTFGQFNFQLEESVQKLSETSKALLQTVLKDLQTHGGNPHLIAKTLSNLEKIDKEVFEVIIGILRRIGELSLPDTAATLGTRLLGQEDKALQEWMKAQVDFVVAVGEFSENVEKARKETGQPETIASAQDSFEVMVERYNEELLRLTNERTAEETKFYKEQLEKGLDEFTENYKPSETITEQWIQLAEKISRVIEMREAEAAGLAGAALAMHNTSTAELHKLLQSIFPQIRAGRQAPPRAVRAPRDPSSDMLNIVKNEYEAAKAMIDAHFQFREDAAGKILDLQDRTKTPEAFREHIENLSKYIQELEKLSKRGDAAFQARVSKELERAKLERKKTVFHLEQSQLQIVKDGALIRVDLLNQKLRETKGILTDVARMELMHQLLQQNLQIAAGDLSMAGGGAEAYQAVLSMMDRLKEAEQSANLSVMERLALYRNLEEEIIQLLENLSKLGITLDATLVQALQTALQKVKEIKTEVQETLAGQSRAALDTAMSVQGARDSYDNHRMTADFNRSISGQTDILDRRLAGIQEDQDRLIQQVIGKMELGPDSKEADVVAALNQIQDVLVRGVEREISALQAAGAAGVGPLMSSRQIQEYADSVLNPEAIQKVVQQYIQKAMDALRASGVSEDVLKDINTEALQGVLTDIVAKKAQQVVDNLAKAQQELIEAIQAGWEEGFNIGFEHGFTEEGFKAMKDMIIRKIGQFVSQTLSKLISESIADGLAEAFSGMEGFMGGGFGKAFAGLVGNIFGSLIGFMIGGFFNQFRDQVESMADQQRKAQRDRVTSSGFDWSYREAEKATPYYEFSPPVTQESVKIVKFVNNFSITTDAAMAMINHQRELERVIHEIVNGMNRTLAKTTGVVI